VLDNLPINIDLWIVWRKIDQRYLFYAKFCKAFFYGENKIIWLKLGLYSLRNKIIISSKIFNRDG